ncbi:MAG TPA: aspartate kinase [Candidatus Acidoferrales bacterium]|nr:aspartate kinase [Candidatus Acidoferrales bacterium]
MSNLCVMKFGGTSVGDASCIARAAEIVKSAAAERPVAVVVSAMSGVTNRLIDAAHHAEAGEGEYAAKVITELRAQHKKALDALVKDSKRAAEVEKSLSAVLAELERLLQGTALLRELTPRALDAISGMGERLSAPLLAAALNPLGVSAVAVSATEVIVTDPHHGRAEPLMGPTRERAEKVLRPLLKKGVVPVVTGFIGATIERVPTTLGRGGSDYSATILGAALDAQETIIWTDVDGVKTADPKLVAEARTIDEISYNEAAELAYFGAKVLHPNTLRPVTAAGVPVWIRNSFAPQKPGTKITTRGNSNGGGVKALTAIRGVTMITVGGPGIVGLTDVLARSFAATSALRINVLFVSQSSSQNDICFVITSADEKRAVEALRAAFAPEIAEETVEHVSCNSNVAIVAVVGENMHGIPGIAGRTFSALGREGINIIAIAQGSSEYNISLVIEATATQHAMRTLHKEFRLHESTAAGSDSTRRSPEELAAGGASVQ